MKSKGTKETQGVNGDAALLQRHLDAAATLTMRDAAPCPYRAHRGTDWTLAAGGPVICGICHPPVVDGVVRRGEPSFDELATAAALRHAPAPQSPSADVSPAAPVQPSFNQIGWPDAA